MRNFFVGKRIGTSVFIDLISQLTHILWRVYEALGTGQCWQNSSYAACIRWRWMGWDVQTLNPSR